MNIRKMDFKVFSRDCLPLTLVIPKFLSVLKFLPLSDDGSEMNQVFYLNKKLGSAFLNLINSSSLLLAGLKKIYFVELELIGLGYRVSLKDGRVRLNLGYSHVIFLCIPKDVFIVKKKYRILVYGLNRSSLGLFVSTLLKFKKLNPYKLKGLRKRHLVYKLKPGKRSK